jgi:NADH-quinone oxidoreductase subunit J
MELLVFVLSSLMVLGGAIGVVAFRNPVHAALGLVLTLFGIAVHFVSLEAHFLAAVQVIVYAGAIVVLFLFVIMLLGVDKAENLRIEPFPVQRWLAGVVGLGLAGLLIATIARGRDTLARNEPLPASGDDNIRALARNLFADHVFAFEFTSVLLIVAVAGTVLLTRKTSPAEKVASAEHAARLQSSSGRQADQ